MESNHIDDMRSQPKFNFKCNACNEEFNIQLRFFDKKQSIECPSCGQRLEEDIFNDIKEATVRLDSALKKLHTLLGYNDGILIGVENKHGFSFSIDWNKSAITTKGGLFK